MPSQILTEIAETYQSATLPWFERLFPIAQRLFQIGRAHV